MIRQMATRAPVMPGAPASPLGALSDDALVHLAVDGSEAAFETLDRRHRAAVFRHCAGILRSSHDADEATQRTMIRAYRAMAGGRGPTSFLPWLLAIARNESYDLIRSRKGTEALTAEIEAGGESPIERVERREQVEALRGDLTELPEAQRRALLLRGVGDLSHAEIARLMGGTPTEMRTLVHEARASLAEFEAGRALPCADVRGRISTGDGRALRARRVRAHIRACEECAAAAAAVGTGTRRLPVGRVASLLPFPLFAAVRAALFGSGQAGVVGTAGPVGAVGVSAAVVASLVIGLGGGGSGGGAVGSPAQIPAGASTAGATATAASASSATTSSGAARGATTTRPPAGGLRGPGVRGRAGAGRHRRRAGLRDRGAGDPAAGRERHARPGIGHGGDGAVHRRGDHAVGHGAGRGHALGRGPVGHGALGDGALRDRSPGDDAPAAHRGQRHHPPDRHPADRDAADRDAGDHRAGHPDPARRLGHPLTRAARGGLMVPRDRGATMTTGDTEIRYDTLDYAETLAKLEDLAGREILVEARVGGLHGPFRLAARGVLVGPPRGQPELTARRPPGDDLEAFMLDNGGFLAVREEQFVSAEWHAGQDEGQYSAQPRLKINFTDSVLHVAVLYRHDPVTPPS